MDSLHATAWLSADQRHSQSARRITGEFFGFHRVVLSSKVPLAARLDTQRSACHRSNQASPPASRKAACAAKSRPLPAADRPCRLGSKQAVTSPPTAAVRLNSGATPTPRRAKRPARLGRDRWRRASGSAQKWRGTRQAGGAHHAPEWPGKKKRANARAPTRCFMEKATPPRPLASNQCQREGQPRSRTKEAIKGAAGRGALSFTTEPKTVFVV